MSPGYHKRKNKLVSGRKLYFFRTEGENRIHWIKLSVPSTLKNKKLPAHRTALSGNQPSNMKKSQPAAALPAWGRGVGGDGAPGTFLRTVLRVCPAALRNSRVIAAGCHSLGPSIFRPLPNLRCPTVLLRAAHALPSWGTTSSLSRLLRSSQLAGIELRTQVWTAVKPCPPSESSSWTTRGGQSTQERACHCHCFQTGSPRLWVRNLHLAETPRESLTCSSPSLAGLTHLQLCRRTCGTEGDTKAEGRNHLRFPWSWAHRSGSINPHWPRCRGENPRKRLLLQEQAEPSASLFKKLWPSTTT